MTHHIAYFSTLPGGPADGYQCYRVVNGKYRLDVGPRHATPAAAAAYADALDAAETAHEAAVGLQAPAEAPNGADAHPAVIDTLWPTAPAARADSPSVPADAGQRGLPVPLSGARGCPQAPRNPAPAVLSPAQRGGTTSRN